MRILYCHYLANDDHPAARMVHAISKELELLGHTVHVHRCLGPIRLTDKQRISSLTGRLNRPTSWIASLKNHLWFARTLLDNLLTAKYDRSAIQSFCPDIILAREDAYRTSIVNEAITAGIPLVTYSDAPVAYECRTFPIASRWHPPGIVEFIEKWWLKSSQAVITPSRPSAHELRKYNVSAPIFVVPNGVNPFEFPQLDDATKHQYRSKLGIPLDKTVVGFHGSFRSFHGIDLLCHLIRSTSHRTDTHWLLIGDGPDKYKVENVSQINPAITILGNQPADCMGPLVGIMDIGVATHMFIPGSFYFSPLKILEYASARCAVIASAQGDIPEMLNFGRAGILIDKPDIEDWSIQLNALLDNYSLRVELGSSAQSWVHLNRTWHKTAECISWILNDVITNSVFNS